MAEYVRGCKKYENAFKEGMISFLRYQRETFAQVEETINRRITTNNLRIRNSHLEFAKDSLTYYWADNDPVVYYLVPETPNSNTHYNKLKLIGESLSRSRPDAFG